MKKVLDITGLSASQVAPVVKELNQLLADYQIYYTNLRGFHWHIEGPRFFELHSQFEKMYDAAAEKVDEIAERILQLDGVPENRYSQHLQLSEVKEVTGVKKCDDCVNNIIETHKILMAKERKIAELAGEAGDEVTVDMMIGFLGEQEKLMWMLTAMMR